MTFLIVAWIAAHPAAALFGCFEKLAEIPQTIMGAIFPDALSMVYA